MSSPRLLAVPAVALSTLVAIATLLAGCAAPEEEATGTSEARLGQGAALVNVDALNLRDGPSTTARVLAVMPKGTRVQVKGEAQDDFVPVRYGELEGWAFGEYLTPVAPLQLRSLAETVAGLAAEAPARSPGTEPAIAVMDLTTDEYAGANDVERHVSASSAKVIWVAAAMHAGANVSDIALPIFRDSNNELSGTAIDRAGGANAVNAFMTDVVGMERSLLANWYSRRASNQGQLGGDNYFTAKDTVRFLTRLDHREILAEAATTSLETMMTWSPRSGYGGWLGTLLPSQARASMMHKAGWLPREWYPDYATMNEIGLVQVPGGHRYAVSILLRHGQDYWGKQQRFLERASCVIYRTIAKDATLDCHDWEAGQPIVPATPASPATPAPVAPADATGPTSMLLDVPWIAQKPELPRGCEVTSLAMLLRHAGIGADKMTLAAQVDKVPYLQSGLYGNPNDGFVGDMYTKANPGYGVYHAPIERLAERYLPGRIVKLTGMPFDELLTQHVGQGRPVWIVTNATFKNLDAASFTTWPTASGDVQITWHDHSVVVTGYDPAFVFINDPLDASANANKKLPREAFREAWEQMGKQAIGYAAPGASPP